MTRWLYRYDAKGIQRWVLGTGKLREIAGASGLLEALAATVEARLPSRGAALQAAAAAGGTVVFDDERALASFAADWVFECARRYPGLSMTHAWVPLDGEPDEATWRTLHERLRASRQRPPKPVPAAGPLVAQAPRSASPAVARVKDDDDRGLLLDAAAHVQRAAYGTTARDALFRRSLPKEREGRRPVEDAEDFGEEYLALVHADGNNIGAHFTRKQKLADYKALSGRLQQCTQRAAQRAADALLTHLEAEWRRTRRNDRRVPLRPIVLGGDDYTVLLRARDAVPFTEHFLRAFEAETKEHLEDFTQKAGFTACAGIVMMKPEFPYGQAHALAEELCKAAKKQLRRSGERTPGGFCLHRVTTAAVRSLDDIRAHELAAEPGPDSARRSLWWGAWTVGEAPGDDRVRSLYELARHLDETPRGMVREWLRLATVDAGEADRHWQRALDVRRLAHRGEWKLLDALRGLGAAAGSPWVAHGADHASPLADALLLHGVTQGWPESWALGKETAR